MFLTKVCGALNKARIGYAVVGGYAVALHGAVRGTLDLDLVLSLDEQSFVRAEQVFTRLGLQSRLPVGAAEVFRFREEYIRNRDLIAWAFFDAVNPANQLDVVITHDAGKLKVESITVHGTRIRIASIKSLIEMKTRAGRPQDLEDVRALREIADEKR